MGALTIKPLAYKVRSWELTNIEIINFLDSYCGKIAVQKRGSEIIRILPSRKDFFYWISDRARFFFEGLKKQRVTHPYILLENKYIKVNWLNIIVFLKYMKYISNWMNEINSVEQKLKDKTRNIYKTIFIDNLVSKGDLISNLYIKLILQTCNLKKYENKNYMGNINKNYYPENLLNDIKNSKYNLINNLYLLNDYPRVWSYIKVNKIILLGIKQQLIFGGLTINNNIKEIIKIKKAKSIFKIFAKNMILFTEEYINIEGDNIKQIVLSKNTEELNSNWVSSKYNNYNIDKNFLIWNFTTSNRKSRGLSLAFATHGNKNDAIKVILPVTTFMEEYSLRVDPYGTYQRSIPVNIRAINMRNLSQILKIIKIIFQGVKINPTVENELLKAILILKYGEINEFFKELPDFLKKPVYIQNQYTLSNNYKENDFYKNSYISNIKYLTLKKNNNY